jgi:ABC-type Zn uptake system ZnuABC Zn-binding protein ZnuA
LTKADLFVTVGLDLETGWSPQLLSSHAIQRFKKTAGYVDASEGVNLLQVPTSANRAEEIFIFMVIRIIGLILKWKNDCKKYCEWIRRVDPSNKSFYEANLVAFNNKIDETKRMAGQDGSIKVQRSLLTIMSGFILKQGLVYRSWILWNLNPVYHQLLHS